MKQELEPHHPSITTLSPIEDVMKKMVAHTATKQDYERISKEELANFRAALDLSKEEDQRTLDLWWRLVLKKKAVSFLTPLLEKLTQNDEISDPRDQRLLGHMYYKGLSVSEDKKKAILWWSKAAEKQDSEALYKSVIYRCEHEKPKIQNNEDLKAENKKVFLFLKMAASKDDERAQIALGDMHYSGLGTEKNALEAIKLWTKAANVGRVDAINKIGYAYLQNNGIDIDPQKAAEYFSVAVKQNDALAQFALGALYYDGQGVKKDHQKALELWTEAAKQGQKEAQYELGGLYYTGEDVPQDYTKAFEWFHKAAEQKNVNAQFSLAMMYYRGDSGVQDYKQAMAWFKKAGEQGHAMACKNVGFMYRDGQGVEANESVALEWILKSVNITNVPS